ncbi:MAG: aminoacyl-tRNA hydrolase [Deltaproteobacteria bacterium]|nr:aminoacyl-tRNA hydrolase [Candidatus Anaeroferrophillacea bacterium]
MTTPEDDGRLWITPEISIPAAEIELSAVRAPGPGGQHVNKASTAIHLRFDIPASSLPDGLKQRLLARGDRRISTAGVLVLKAAEFRRQEQNRAAARERLRALIAAALVVRRSRRPTRPTRGAREQRLEFKKRRGRVKALRGRVE